MKKFVLFIIIVALLTGYFFVFKDKNSTKKDTNIESYRNYGLGISFDYPKVLDVSTSDGIIVLHHDIPFENTGACDMMGEEKTYPR